MVAMVNSFTTIAGMESYWTLYEVYSLYSESKCYNIPGSNSMSQNKECETTIIVFIIL